MYIKHFDMIKAKRKTKPQELEAALRERIRKRESLMQKCLDQVAAVKKSVEGREGKVDDTMDKNMSMNEDFIGEAEPDGEKETMDLINKLGGE